MAPRGSQTSPEIRKLIMEHFKKGETIRNIAEIVKKPKSTVFNIVKRYANSENYENLPKPSKRKIFSDSDERWLVRQIKKNPNLSAPKLASEAEIRLGKTANPETIRNVLRKHDLHGRVARRKPFINKVNKQKRVNFAREYRNKDFSFWRKVIFTDESKYNIFRSDGLSYIWRKPNTELLKQNLRPTVKHGLGSVMVWGAISAAGPGNLHIIEGIMDHRYYIDVLKSNLSTTAEKLGLGNDYYFYQDNDPKHKAYNVRSWLLYNCPHVLETPPQSPDLNPIEHVWSHLEQKLKSRQISNKKELVVALKEEWSNISPEYCRKLVESMPNRLRAVIQQKGLPTKY